MKLKKFVLSTLLFAVAAISNLNVGQAATLLDPTDREMRGVISCPAPNQVKCKKFAESVGAWTQNGGYTQSHNTAFTPNNQCANVIKINENGNNTRLLCCYNDCGVLTLDVKYQNCTKINQATFRCQ